MIARGTSASHSLFFRAGFVVMSEADASAAATRAMISAYDLSVGLDASTGAGAVICSVEATGSAGCVAVTIGSADSVAVTVGSADSVAVTVGSTACVAVTIGNAGCDVV
jgi:hypothetical protein